MSRITDLRVRQLDEALRPFARLRDRPPPPQGWVRTIREGLGMSLRQLAERAGLSKTAIHSVEATEAAGTARLDSLRTLAEAMECDLVYALVPRTSLHDLIGTQADRRARSMVGRVSDSMDLEEQGVPRADRDRQVQEIAEEIARTRRRDFWDD